MSWAISKTTPTHYNKSFQWFYKSQKAVGKHFSITLNVPKLYGVFCTFKRIMFGIGYFNLYLFAFGTKEFKPEVNALNQIYRFANMNNHYYSFFHTSNFFADKVPYTVEVD